MSAGSDARDSIVTIEHLGRRRALRASELPLTVGGDAGAGFPIDGLPGVIRIGRLGGVFFVETGRAARNLRVGGVPVAGTRELMTELSSSRLNGPMSPGRWHEPHRDQTIGAMSLVKVRRGSAAAD